MRGKAESSPESSLKQPSLLRLGGGDGAGLRVAAPTPIHDPELRDTKALHRFTYGWRSRLGRGKTHGWLHPDGKKPHSSAQSQNLAQLLARGSWGRAHLSHLTLRSLLLPGQGSPSVPRANMRSPPRTLPARPHSHLQVHPDHSLSHALPCRHGCATFADTSRPELPAPTTHAPQQPGAQGYA